MSCLALLFPRRVGLVFLPPFESMPPPPPPPPPPPGLPRHAACLAAGPAAASMLASCCTYGFHGCYKAWKKKEVYILEGQRANLFLLLFLLLSGQRVNIRAFRAVS